jgi:undecaprenyl diphosphate synthase
MSLLKVYAERERAELVEKGVEVRVLGSLERMQPSARTAVERIMRATAGGTTLKLNLMISYSGREDILTAVRRLAARVAAGELEPEQIDDACMDGALLTQGIPDPDLLIRTSGEFRISNFMFWQISYSEIHITPVLWPDFSREDFFGAVLEYQRRDRRFGRITSV